MNNAKQVDEQIRQLKVSGIPLSEAAWRAALLCVGWPYVFGARGEYCTPANRRARYSESHPTIKTACKNFDGAGSCSGCKWYPGGERVRFFDCRGFTYWILLQVFGWKLQGAGATSQWNNDSNWAAKGEIGTIPDDALVCLFVKKGSKMEHTGFGYNGETCECSSGVQHFTSRDKKWTHWAIPACEGADPGTGKPTLRKGDSGPYVTLAQTELIQRGYDLGKWGADGKYGSATERAVRQFQQDWDLKVDGIIGPVVWGYLESTPVKVTYTVTVPNLSLKDAEALTALYPGAYMKKEAED